MAEDTYTYYAVSPIPASTDGLRASYDIPAVQDGTFHGEWDVMVATPIEDAAPLREHDKKGPERHQRQYGHRQPAIFAQDACAENLLPKNDLGEPISEIESDLPEARRGRLTVDAANPAAAAELSGSRATR